MWTVNRPRTTSRRLAGTRAFGKGCHYVRVTLLLHKPGTGRVGVGELGPQPRASKGKAYSTVTRLKLSMALTIASDGRPKGKWQAPQHDTDLLCQVSWPVIGWSGACRWGHCLHRRTAVSDLKLVANQRILISPPASGSFFSLTTDNRCCSARVRRNSRIVCTHSKCGVPHGNPDQKIKDNGKWTGSA